MLDTIPPAPVASRLDICSVERDCFVFTNCILDYEFPVGSCNSSTLRFMWLFSDQWNTLSKRINKDRLIDLGITDNKKFGKIIVFRVHNVALSRIACLGKIIRNTVTNFSPPKLKYLKRRPCRLCFLVK